MGLAVPQKAIVETFSVNLKRTEERVVISFDAGVLQSPTEPIGGLSVWQGGQLVVGPGDGSTATDSAFEPNGHVHVADQPEKCVLGDSGAFSMNGNGNGSRHST
jgi:hypothetical protein